MMNISGKFLVKLTLSIVTVSLLMVMPALVIAQESDDIDISANVLESLSISGVNDLQFGDVIQGQESTVEPDESEAGRFDINGSAGSEVEVSFTLPSELERDGGAETMPITFSSTSAISHTENDPGEGETFNPDTGATTSFHGTDGELFIFIGGTLEPASNQEPGSYEGTITLTADYTGN